MNNIDKDFLDTLSEATILLSSGQTADSDEYKKAVNLISDALVSKRMDSFDSFENHTQYLREYLKSDDFKMNSPVKISQQRFNVDIGHSAMSSFKLDLVDRYSLIIVLSGESPDPARIGIDVESLSYPLFRPKWYTNEHLKLDRFKINKNLSLDFVKDLENQVYSFLEYPSSGSSGQVNLKSFDLISPDAYDEAIENISGVVAKLKDTPSESFNSHITYLGNYLKLVSNNDEDLARKMIVDIGLSLDKHGFDFNESAAVFLSMGMKSITSENELSEGAFISTSKLKSALKNSGNMDEVLNKLDLK